MSVSRRILTLSAGARSLWNCRSVKNGESHVGRRAWHPRGRRRKSGTQYEHISGYGDSRPRAEQLSGEMVRKLAELASFPAFAKLQSELTDPERHRRTGIGALLGCTDGLGGGSIAWDVAPCRTRCSLVLGWNRTRGRYHDDERRHCHGSGQTNPKEWPALRLDRPRDPALSLRMSHLRYVRSIHKALAVLFAFLRKKHGNHSSELRCRY